MEEQPGCSICFSEEGYICGNSTCECSQFREEDGLVKIVHENKNETNHNHYFHSSCLFHYHQHNQGDCFVCPLCKYKIIGTDPSLSFLSQLTIENSRCYHDTEMVEQAYVHAIFASNIIQTANDLLFFYRTTFNTREFDFDRILIPVFKRLIVFLEYKTQTFFDTPNALPISIIYSLVDNDRKRKMLYILSRYYGYVIDETLMVDLVYFYQTCFYSPQNLYNALNDIIEYISIHMNEEEYDEKIYELISRKSQRLDANLMDMISIRSLYNPSMNILFDIFDSYNVMSSVYSNYRTIEPIFTSSSPPHKEPRVQISINLYPGDEL